MTPFMAAAGIGTRATVAASWVPGALENVVATVAGDDGDPARRPART